jgi:hypothetical protein
MVRWLVHGEVPIAYAENKRAGIRTLLRSLKLGATQVDLLPGGRIARIISLERDALKLGYHLAPVVLLLNPSFEFGNGFRGRKYLLAQFESGYVDLHSVCASLKATEPGWGGSATIKGSPQDRPSLLLLEFVEKLLSANLIGGDAVLEQAHENDTRSVCRRDTSSGDRNALGVDESTDPG